MCLSQQYNAGHIGGQPWPKNLEAKTSTGVLWPNNFNEKAHLKKIKWRTTKNAL